MPNPKWFTVATEGDTTDGRVIERKWLEEIADTYDHKKYGARIWLEHVKGLLPDSPFRAYGDVLAVRTAENDDGQLTLQAQLDPTPDLVALSKARQKIYTSMEIDPNFAKSGKTGLVGLGITDTPASLGTDILQFAAQNPDKHPFAARKHDARNLFTAAMPVHMDFSEAAPQNDSDSLLRKMTEAFRSLIGTTKAEPAPAALSELSTAFGQFAGLYAKQQQAGADKLQAMDTKLTDMERNFSELREQLDATDRSTTHRPSATGGNGAVQTDC